MEKAVALIGVGEMGGVFARGLLKKGHPVFPVTRDMDLKKSLEAAGDVEAVIVGVGEKALASTLKAIPQQYYDRLVLLQNELLPKDWESHQISNPTVISVWFEKKYPNDFKVIIPSPVFGSKAQLIADALGSINIPCNILKTQDDLLFELVLKNLYILTTNIAGLEVGGNVGELWEKHQAVAQEVISEVLDIQFAMIGQSLDKENLIQAMVKAFDGDPEHKCMGRSAPARLERAIEQADQLGVAVKKLKSIQSTKV